MREMESRFFVGRARELDLFRRLLEAAPDGRRVLNVCGPGGVGKSWLLGAFHRLARSAGARFVLVDSRGVVHSPSGVAAKLIQALCLDPPGEGEDPFAACIRALHGEARQRPVVVALDTYEEMGDLDPWVREGFLPALPPGVRVIIAGRHPLQGGWRESPAWRQCVLPLPLADFDFEESRLYLSRCGIHQTDHQLQIWNLTQGHPLALTLAAALVERQGISALARVPERAEVFAELARRWLCEVPDEKVRSLLEAAAVVRAFDQELLEHMTGEPVTARDFQRLTGLSFVRRVRHGWALHDLVRAAVGGELRWRLPARYQQYWQRALGMTRRRAAAAGPEEARAAAMNEFFYLLDDAMIRAAFFAEPAVDPEVYVVPARAENLEAVKGYLREWERRWGDVSVGTSIDLVDRDTQARFSHFIPPEVSVFEVKHLKPAELLKLAPEGFRLAMDLEGAIRGLAITVPVNRRTLGFLRSEPVTRHYFQKVSPAELSEYASRTAGATTWFIRLIDVRDPADLATWAALFRDLLRLAFHGERVVASTSLPFYQEMLRRFGFEEIPGATHLDYGPGQPSPTYLLDIRGARLGSWLEGLAVRAGAALAPDPPVDAFGLSEREREVVRMVLAGLSNAGIAARLGVAEVTVKKHLSRIFAKTGTGSRTQLMKRVFEASQTGT